VTTFNMTLQAIVEDRFSVRDKVRTWGPIVLSLLLGLQPTQALVIVGSVQATIDLALARLIRTSAQG